MILKSGTTLLKSSVNEIGGKASGLVDLKLNGFSVPDFVVLPTETLWFYIESDFWQEQVVGLYQGQIKVDQAAEKMAAKIEAIQFSKEFEAELLSHLAQMSLSASGVSFAVRSSVADEDGGQFSFAGQMETFLFQKTSWEILQSIKKVWKSAFATRVLEYRLLQKISLKQIQAAVIVQKMISAEISGVLFTANPGTGNRFETLISAAPGVGEGIVSGAADCDEFTVDHKTGLIEKNLFSSGRVTLSDPQIWGLAHLGEKLSYERKAPVDIEWAIEKGEIYFLQARPITSEILRTRKDNQLRVFDNSNIQESFCGITLPLTFSFASEAYEQVYTQLMRVMGFSKPEIAKHQIRHRNMLSYVNGRVYYNIQSWYDGLRFLPSFGKNKADMERMMGVEYPVDFVEDQTLSPLEKVRRLPQMISIVFKLGIKFLQIQALVRGFDQWFSQQYREFDRKGLFRLNSQELLDLVRTTKVRFLENWAVPIINDFYVMMNNGKVFRALKSVEMTTEQPALLFGEKLESTEPTKRILSIAERIHNNPLAARVLNESKSGREFLRNLKIEAPEIFHICEEYIKHYGDRVMGELKLESISLHQDPEFLHQLLLNSQTRNLQELESREHHLRSEAENKVFAAIQKQSGARALRKFKNDLKNLRRGIVYREKMRMSRTKVFGLFREIYSEIGQQWQQIGLLENQRDIFYLTETEIEQQIESRAVHQNLKELIVLRKLEFSRWQENEPPAHFSVRAPWIDAGDFKLPQQAAICGEWKGLGCFPGRVQGEVRVVMSSDEKLDLSGKILVTMRTDPGWAPLFVNIKGLLVERGSSLSHSAVIARELGIPTIVGISDVTKRLKSGDLIEFDGSEGWIKNVSENDSRPTL